MNIRAFDGLTRRLGRRRSLQALSVAAIATVNVVMLADAKNGKNTNGGNRKKNKQQKVLALCKGQVQECAALISEQCNDDEVCLADVQRCCQLLATCDFAGLVPCLQTPVEN